MATHLIMQEGMPPAPIYVGGNDHLSTYLGKNGHLSSLSTYLRKDGHLSTNLELDEPIHLFWRIASTYRPIYPCTYLGGDGQLYPPIQEGDGHLYIYTIRKDSHLPTHFALNLPIQGRIATYLPIQDRMATTHLVRRNLFTYLPTYLRGNGHLVTIQEEMTTSTHLFRRG